MQRRLKLWHMNTAAGQDAEDLRNSRKGAEECDQNKTWWQRLGPGIITGAADDDPSGIGTYSANGAQFGYTLLWLVPLCLPPMIAIQEMCGRIGSITGQGLAAVLKQHYPRWLLLSCVALLIGANIFNIYADLNVMAASTTMLFGIPFYTALFITAGAVILLQIFVPYRLYAQILKWLCLSLFGYVIVALLPGVHNDWPKILKATFWPHISLKSDSILAVVAFLGTTISPYLFFWQAGETVEEVIADGNSDGPGERMTAATNQEIRNIRADTIIGMTVSQLAALFIVVATAGTLHRQGITDINTAQDAAKALLPLGPAAYWIFTLSMLGTGLLAIPTLAGSAAYAVAESAGWRYGLYRRFGRAKSFYLTIAVVVALGYGINFIHAISPIKALVYSAALNGVIAPPLMIVLLFICNNRRIMGERTNGLWANVWGWVGIATMGPAAIYLIYAMLMEKA